MEKKINIAELLKDCPKGMELYSPIFGKVYLDKIRPHLAIVVTDNDKELGDFREEFLYDGRYGMHGECMLFPSKKNRDWSKFHRPFKDGDVVYYCDTISIFKEWGDETLFRTHAVIYLCSEILDVNTPLFGKGVRREIRLATEEEKQKLFDTIRENGYKWNSETKTLEKLPKFKIGDRIKSIISSSCYTIVDIKNDQYVIKSDTEKYPYQVSFRYEINYELVSDTPALKPKFKIGDKIRKKGEYSTYTITDVKYEHYCCGKYVICNINEEDWELVPDKFDITTLKPFDKVLVRLTKDGVWNATFFSRYDKDVKWGCYPFVTTSSKSYSMCIPYEENKHLWDTTDDCDDFYKTW